MYSWHTHPAKRKNIVLRARPGGKGGTEKNGFQEGKRPTIIGTEKVNDTFGSSKFPCSFKKELVFLAGNGLQTTRIWIHINRKCGSSGFPSPRKMSRSMKFTQWAAEHNTCPKILPQSSFSLSEIASIVISRENI